MTFEETLAYTFRQMINAFDPDRHCKDVEPNREGVTKYYNECLSAIYAIADKVGASKYKIKQLIQGSDWSYEIL